ncbi:Tripartite-type tricarboxylate transporter, receptor component TctC [Polaromonas sp. OV174]|uniref:Bug family tripartite tricarboxylate transporter substrate binding protein n=1 Tax=Polaromonas sp. OV174 TaxID=1855300 RepID=UPI0008ED5F6B|nr:tripartite tricarboxylate transporter substrate binding protein [Polaromonas sp. OV174]SFC79685.1 Tripartite-type tricarboxylate transporter, receptor component TctC [Polaromonas sp. OV174]
MQQLKSALLRTLVLATALGAGLAVATQSAYAQEWPTKPVRIVVGGPAGGTADALARIVAEGLTQSLGKPIIVDNKPGAAGALAVNDLIKSSHDGHTLLLIQGGIVSETPQAYKVNFDPFKDLKPLAQVSRQGLVLVANNNVPAKNLKELIGYIKTKKGGVDYASYATGMRAHTAGVQFSRLAGVEMKHIGYKGSPPGLQDVLGGHVPLMFDAPATSLQLIKAGKIKAYAVNYPTRITALPDVPTFTELGFPELNEVGWMGLWATPDLSPIIQTKVRDLTLQYLNQPKQRQRIEAMGMEAGQPLTSEELTKDLHTAYDRQGELLRSIKYKSE